MRMNHYMDILKTFMNGMLMTSYGLGVYSDMASELQLY